MQRQNMSLDAHVGEDAFTEPGYPYFDAETYHDLIRSRSSEWAINTDAGVDQWIADKMATAHLSSRIIPIGQIEGWQIEGATGNIHHLSGKFFTITGVQARHRTRRGDLEWDQPIIDQPEIGILGILAKKIEGVLHFCLQAKEEPGNIHSVQLSPTVQATYSNYTRVHGGKVPQFIDYFLDPPQQAVLYAKLQTEDGGRFLFKSNRNMVVKADDNEFDYLSDGYIWLTLRQIAQLLRRDNLVNACARSVLSALFLCRHSSGIELPQVQASRAGKGGHGSNDPFGAPCVPVVPRERGRTGFIPIEHIQWLDSQKSDNHIFQKRIPLRELWDWNQDASGYLVHRRGKFFKIIGLQVTSRSREIRTWCQPIMDNVATGIIGLLVRSTPDGMECLMQAKADVGNRSIIQIAPTVQFTQENYVKNERLNKPFLYEEFIAPRVFIPVAESRQSEEGARFYQEEHVHRILMLPEQVDLDIPPDYRWFSEQEIHWFLHFGEQVNSCARSILAVYCSLSEEHRALPGR